MLVYQRWVAHDKVPFKEGWPELPERAEVIAADSHFVLADVPEAEAEEFVEKSTNYAYIKTITEAEGIPAGWYVGEGTVVYVDERGIPHVDEVDRLEHILENLPDNATLKHVGDIITNDPFVVSADTLGMLLHGTEAMDMPARIVGHDTIELMMPDGHWEEEFKIED